MDDAPVHLLRREYPEFIAPTMWSPNSWELNQVDYRIRGVVQERVWQTQI